jgi:undecaprenyl pyrophosphate phosphatase UppP
MVRLWEIFLGWYHLNDDRNLLEEMIMWYALKRKPIRCVPIVVNGTVIYTLIASDLRHHPRVVCRSRSVYGSFLKFSEIDAFVVGGKRYPARLLPLYIKVGLYRVSREL